MFLVMFLITLTTGTCSTLGSLGSSEFWSIEHAISLGVLLIAPVLLPAVVKMRESIEKKRERRVHDLTIDEGRRDDRVVVLELKEEEPNSELREEEVSLGSMLQKLDFWLYFFSYMFGATLGLVFLNNLGQIAESRGFSHVSSLVSLSSSMGFFGRLMPSLLDYYVAKREGMISRPGFMATMMAPMAAAFFMLLKSSHLILYISTAIIGACSGAITSIAVSATPELFGTKNFAVNHNVVVANIPIGSFVFGYLAALLYQRGGGMNTCIGVECYSKTFVIWCCVCSFGTVLCTALYLRRRLRFRSPAGEEANSGGDEE
ncbi:hypothetical protein HPP92_019268 [Vanilla planifolia]|uniref:NFD4 C-terminal domain-containing protein n=1 Tax=Vanilla planifolia TaxID=51239 RepID=A0A835Q8N6_VANPL|nr:hypothetical protein HPP92_019268 [Vanilla planifolia]